jgi:hypothetical protein
MTDYNVRFTDTNKLALTVEQDSERLQGIDLVLFGRSLLEYGEQLNENMLRLLENFACPESVSSAGFLGYPDSSLANDTLTEPVAGQLWYNTTRKGLYQHDGTRWNKLASGSDYAANWGQVADGQLLPMPVASDGYVFSYDECVWVVSPAGHAGRFDYMIATTDAATKVNMKYRQLGTNNLTSGNVNYLIVGIRGNTNGGLASYSQVGVPGITPTPTPSPAAPTPTPSAGATQTPTPTVTPTITVSPSMAAPTPTPAPTSSGTPTPTAAASPTPTRTPTPTPTPPASPTPTPIPALAVQIVDSARGGAYAGTVTLCDKRNYSTTRDYGNLGCTINFGTCDSGACAPEPGTYAGGENDVGAAMGITVSGGVAPYTVNIKNFTVSSDAGGTFANSGECVFFGGSNGFGLPYAGTAYSFTIGSSGGYVSGLEFRGACGVAQYTVSGTFAVEVRDALGATITNTYNYDLVRLGATGTGGGTGPGGGGCVTTDSMIYGSGPANTVQVGDEMAVIDPITYALGTGEVSRADIGPQPCVRITSASGVTLECSTTAPIALSDGSQCLAPALLGKTVAVMIDGTVVEEEVVLIEDIGEKDVVYITCENNFFLAGAEEGKYFLHHNLKTDVPHQAE